MTTTAKGATEEAYYEANRALLQAKGLIFVGQEAYTSADSDGMYELLSVLDEKVCVAHAFLQDNEYCWELKDNVENLQLRLETVVMQLNEKKHGQEETE